MKAFSLGVAKSSSLSSLNIAHCGFVDSPVGDAKTVSIPLQLIHAIGIAPLKQLVLRFECDHVRLLASLILCFVVQLLSPFTPFHELVGRACIRNYQSWFATRRALSRTTLSSSCYFVGPVQLPARFPKYFAADARFVRYHITSSKFWQLHRMAWVFTSSLFLQLLNLAGNHIHSDGAQKIAVFLKSNKSLQNLCLPHNDIEDSGGCEIFYAL